VGLGLFPPNLFLIGVWLPRLGPPEKCWCSMQDEPLPTIFLVLMFFLELSFFFCVFLSSLISDWLRRGIPRISNFTNIVLRLTYMSSNFTISSSIIRDSPLVRIFTPSCFSLLQTVILQMFSFSPISAKFIF